MSFMSRFKSDEIKYNRHELNFHRFNGRLILTELIDFIKCLDPSPNPSSKGSLDLDTLKIRCNLTRTFWDPCIHLFYEFHACFSSTTVMSFD